MGSLDLQKLYEILMKQYGSQGWWPVLSWQGKGTNPTLRGRLTGYHCDNFDVPGTEAEMFEIMVGAILTQNTSWVNAEKALWQLYNKGVLLPSKIKEMPLEKLAILIQSSGYYNQKAKRLLEFVEFLAKNPIAVLISTPISEVRTLLRSVKGVGDETADSMILYALKKPIFVVDAYTRRLLIRLGLLNVEKIESIVGEPAKEPQYIDIQALFHRAIPANVCIYNEYHALIVQHSVHVCEKSPHCEQCFLQADCPKKIAQSIKPKVKPKLKSNIMRKN